MWCGSGGVFFSSFVREYQTFETYEVVFKMCAR